MDVGVIDISVGIIALSFLVLVIYIIKTLKTMQSSLTQMSETMVHIQNQVDEVSKETTELIRNTNLITVDIQKKSKALDSLFQSIQNAGVAAEQVTQSVKEVSSTLTNSVQQSFRGAERHQNKFSQIVGYLSLALKLWKKWQSRNEKKDGFENHSKFK